MLIDFEVENFRSYRQARKFSLVASSSTELPGNRIELPDHKMALLRSAALYGPNASGKSNLIAAMNSLSEMLESPVNRPLSMSNSLHPFALDRTSASRETTFRTRFITESVVYEYSLSCRPGAVAEEILSAYPLGRAQVWFHRRGKEIDFNRTHLKGQKQAIQDNTPSHVPFLAVAAAFDHPQLTPIARWLATNCGDRFVALDFSFRFTRRRSVLTAETTRLCLMDKSFRSWANALLRHADLGIMSVEIDVSEEKVPGTMYIPLSKGLKERRRVTQEVMEEHHEPFFVHSGEDGMTSRFSLGEESHGTRRLYAMLAPFYQVLQGGQLAVVDELSASLHPSLVRELIRLFHDRHFNAKGAQLVFATHDPSLLSGRFFRRDQVWFTEKDRVGATDLYSLQDVKGVREDEAFEKSYLRGRYGAIPFFGQFDFPPESETAESEDEQKSE